MRGLRPAAALGLALCMGLGGCSSMLDMEYVSPQPHNQSAVLADDGSNLRVENYLGLVNAVQDLVNARQEQGIIYLDNYTQDVQQDLDRACNEVHHEDPMGAYAVEYISPSYSRSLTYYKATINVVYKRTLEQMKGVVSVTGSSAIRNEVGSALEAFRTEIVLRVTYFMEDSDYIRGLVRQAYYDTPQAAFGSPRAEITLYPQQVDTGDSDQPLPYSDARAQRIVEILLTYPEDPELLREKREELEAAAALLLEELKTGLKGEGLASALFDELRRRQGEPEEDGTQPLSPTAHAALVEGAGDSEGLALAYKLLCDRAGLECVVVEGRLDGAPHFWNVVTVDGARRHVDAGDPDGLLLTDGELLELGAYGWDREEVPPCVDPEAAAAAESGKDIEISS